MSVIGKNLAIGADDLTRGIAARRLNPALIWGGIGAALLLLEIYVLGSWIASARFVPTDPGPDPIPFATLCLLRFFETIGPISFFVIMWYLVIKPWRRDGRPSVDAMLAISWMLLVYQDPFLNYTSTQYFINSHFVNFGSWTSISTPGWTSPNGNQLPEPLLNWTFAYMWFGFLPAMLGCAVMRGYKRKFPRAHDFELFLTGWAALSLVDLVGESLMIRGGLYAYPGHLNGFTLWAGQTYEFPLNEMVLMSLVMACTASLRFFVNDKGQTFVERGIERLKVSMPQQHLLRFLAIYGWVHLTMLVLYNVPQQWVGTHTDAFPSGYPSYMVNHMCVSGNGGNQCPGPGIAIPRP